MTRVSQAAGEGWGLKIAKIAPCPFSLHSYLHPLGLSLLPPTIDQATTASEETARESSSIRNMVETKNVSFFARVAEGSYVVQTEPGWFRSEIVFGFVCGAGSGLRFFVGSVVLVCVSQVCVFSLGLWC